MTRSSKKGPYVDPRLLKKIEGKKPLETGVIKTLAQIELWTNSAAYKNEVYMLPKHLDEKVAALHLAKLGVELEILNPEQAAYIGVEVKGPFKPEYYRY
jgi:hypothetical protein